MSLVEHAANMVVAGTGAAAACLPGNAPNAKQGSSRVEGAC